MRIGSTKAQSTLGSRQKNNNNNEVVLMLITSHTDYSSWTVAATVYMYMYLAQYVDDGDYGQSSHPLLLL